MEKSKSLQLPIIVLLLVLLIWQTLSYSEIKAENSKIKPSGEASLMSEVKQEGNTAVLVSDSIVRESDSSQIVDAVTVEETQGNGAAQVAVPFDKQVIDYEWAYNTETAINDIFETHQYLDKISLENIECRTSACQLRITKKSKDNLPQDSLDNLHQASLVFMALDDMGIETAKNLRLDLQEDNNTLVLLVHKPEYR